MSASDMKRSKRRRNKRGGGGGNGKPNRQQKQTAIGDQIITAAKMSATLSDLDLDNIPQPLTQLPMRSSNPYLQEREHCLLCRRERPDKGTSHTGDGKDGGQTNIKQVSMCLDCQGERNAARNSHPPLLPQEFLLQPPFSPLLKLDGTLNVPASLLGPAATTAATGKGGSSSEATCACEPCRERREIAAEQELVRQQLAESWSELSHVVRCVYWEAGTALAEDEDSSKLSLPRMKEILQRLCAHDPHQLYLQLELEVDDYLKEISGRLGRQLAAGYKTLAAAKQFVGLLLEEYDALCSAAKTLSAVLEQLEKEHLSKFQLTWLRHNMHMFHITVYATLGLREKFSCLINELRQGTGSKEACLLHRYLKFDEDMSVISVEWRDCQQLIDKYHEDQMPQDCLRAKQQTLGVDWEFLKAQKIFSDHGGLKAHALGPDKDKGVSGKCHAASGVLGRLLNGGEADHKDTTCKKRCPCDECSIARLTSSLLTPDLYEEIGLKHLQEVDSPAHLSPLDSYLQSINPPDLSSASSSESSSSECSSQEDSDGVLQIFSRNDLNPSGFSSPRSEDSEDSDDLDSNTSPSPSQNGDGETEGRCKAKRNRRTNGDGSSSSGCSSSAKEAKSSRDGSKKESASGRRSCTSRACTASHKVLPTFGGGGAPDKHELHSQPPSYLFYPNLANRLPLDLSHHGISAKHPFIHPHLYNLTSQKTTTSTTKVAMCQQQQQQQQVSAQQQQQLPQQQPFQLSMESPEVGPEPLGQAYGDWKSGAFESAKMVLNSRGYCSGGGGGGGNTGNSAGHSTDPDLLQSVRAALHQSNCKAAAAAATDRGPLLGAVPSSSEQQQQQQEQQPWKQHTAKKVTKGNSNSNGKKRANHVCLEAATNGSTAAASGGTTATSTAKEHSVQHHHHHHHNQSTAAVAAADSSGKKSRADGGGGGSIVDRCARHGLAAGKSPASTSAIMQAYQQQCSQLEHAGLMTNGLHGGGGGDAAPQGSKKKKAEEDSGRYDIISLANECGDDRPPQSCIHHGHATAAGVMGQPAGLCSSTLQTATSTPTSASICSDPDCETHNFINDDDMYGGCYDDRGGANGNRERESKHCDCYYCEFFGHGGPQPAPTSRNYTENRDRLRLKLRDRQKRQPKDQSPSSADHNLEFDQFDHLDLSDERTLDDLLSFINGEQQRQKSSAKTKAAKRHRQKQRKAEEKARLEAQQEALRQEGLRRLREEERQKREAIAAFAEAAKIEQQRLQREHEEKLQREQQRQQQQQTKQQQQKNGKPEAPSLKAKKKGGKEVQQQQQQQQQGKQEQGSKQQQQQQPKTNQSSNGQPAATAVPKSSASRLSPTKQVTVQQQSTQQSKQQPQQSNQQSKHQLQQQQQQAPTELPNSSKGSLVKDKSKQQQSQGSKQDSNHHSSSNNTSTGHPQEKSQRSQQQSTTKQAGKSNGKQDSTSSSSNNNSSSISSSQTKNGKQTSKKSADTSSSSNDSSNHQLKRVTQTPAVSSTSRSATAGKKTAAPQENHHNKQASNSNSNGGEKGKTKEPSRSQAPQGTAAVQPQSKKADQSASTGKQQQHEQVAVNGVVVGSEPQTNGNVKKKKKKRNSSENPNASIDEIFMPKENADMADMDETEREIEDFKRFCMQLTPAPNKEKVVFSMKELNLKKGAVSAH